MAGGGSACSTAATVGFFTAGSPGSTSAPIGVSEGPWAKAQSNIAAAGCQVPVGLAVSDKREVLPPASGCLHVGELGGDRVAVLDTYGALVAEEQCVVIGIVNPGLSLPSADLPPGKEVCLVMT